MKRLVSLALVLVLIVSLVGCAGGKDAPAAAADAAYPMTLTDQAGRTVVIPAEPNRIVSSYYITSSALIALGLQDRMVGIENNAEKRPVYSLSAPALLELPGVGTVKEFDLEGCMALEPELVILPMRLKSAAESLEALDIPVLLVNPESQELLGEMIDLIGCAANVQERADALNAFLQEQTKVLSGIAGEAPTVYLGGNSAFLSTAGGNMYQSSLISLAGGKNVAEALTDTKWAEISYEQLLAWDPEYIILASDASYTVEDVLKDANLAGCRAVVNGRVFHLPNDVEAWDSPVPSGILGALWLASLLHGDKLPAETVAQTVTDYYKTFYGFDYALS